MPIWSCDKYGKKGHKWSNCEDCYNGYYEHIKSQVLSVEPDELFVEIYIESGLYKHAIFYRMRGRMDWNEVLKHAVESGSLPQELVSHVDCITEITPTKYFEYVTLGNGLHTNIGGWR